MLVAVPTAALHPWTVGPGGRARRPPRRARSAGSPGGSVWSLAARGSSGARAALVARLHDPDPATRGVAAWGLGKLGDRAALEPLVAALHDADAHVREMVVLALGDLHDLARFPRWFRSRPIPSTACARS